MRFIAQDTILEYIQCNMKFIVLYSIKIHLSLYSQAPLPLLHDSLFLSYVSHIPTWLIDPLYHMSYGPPSPHG